MLSLKAPVIKKENKMQFSPNSPIIFVIVGVIIAVVLAQSVYFLIKSYRHAKEIGMDMKVIKKTITSSAIFTVAPAVSIVITILVLANSLGIALPWLRLSVVGSLSYETVAAANAASGLGKTLESLAGNMTASDYVTIATVMTVSIMVGIWLVPVVAKKMQRGMLTFENKDKKWSDILQNSLFIGMISAFLGYVFSDISRLWLADENGVFTQVTDDGAKYFTSTSGLVPVLVMLVSAVLMAVCGILIKRLNLKWLNDYALPVCMIIGMVVAIPLTSVLGGEIV